MSVKSGTLLIQFAQRPLAGVVKPHLIPALGAEGAVQVHLALMTQTLQTLAGSGLGDVELWLDKVPALTDQLPMPFYEMIAACQNAGIERQAQIGVNLGDRIYQALAAGLMHHESVLLVGSDCPVLEVGYLQEALGLLNEGETVVFGPAEDGVFVLVGARRVHPHMFANVEWGTPDVLHQTLANCTRLDLATGCLERLWAVDQPADVARWQRLMR